MRVQHLIYPLACSWDVKLYPINPHSECPFIHLQLNFRAAVKQQDHVLMTRVFTDSTHSHLFCLHQFSSVPGPQREEQILILWLLDKYKIWIWQWHWNFSKWNNIQSVCKKLFCAQWTICQTSKWSMSDIYILLSDSYSQKKYAWQSVRRDFGPHLTNCECLLTCQMNKCVFTDTAITNTGSLIQVATEFCWYPIKLRCTGHLLAVVGASSGDLGSSTHRNE